MLGVLRFREQQNQAQLPCNQDHTSQQKLDLILEALGSSLGRGEKIYFLMGPASSDSALPGHPIVPWGTASLGALGSTGSGQ